MKKFLKVALLVVLLITIFSVSNSVWGSWQKLNGLKGSQEEIAKLKVENKKLEAEKSFRQSNFYVEQQAREKLGLSQNGEVTYVSREAASKSAKAEGQEETANWLSWIRLFTE